MISKECDGQIMNYDMCVIVTWVPVAVFPSSLILPLLSTVDNITNTYIRIYMANIIMKYLNQVLSTKIEFSH